MFPGYFISEKQDYCRNVKITVEMTLAKYKLQLDILQ